MGTQLALGASAAPRFQEIPMSKNDFIDADALPLGLNVPAREV